MSVQPLLNVSRFPHIDRYYAVEIRVVSDDIGDAAPQCGGEVERVVDEEVLASSQIVAALDVGRRHGRLSKRQFQQLFDFRDVIGKHRDDARIALQLLERLIRQSRIVGYRFEHHAPVQHLGDDDGREMCFDLTSHDAGDEVRALRRETTEVVDEDVSVNEAARTFRE